MLQIFLSKAAVFQQSTYCLVWWFDSSSIGDMCSKIDQEVILWIKMSTTWTVKFCDNYFTVIILIFLFHVPFLCTNNMVCLLFLIFCIVFSFSSFLFEFTHMPELIMSITATDLLPPTNLRATATSSSSIRLSWEDNNECCDQRSYEIRYKPRKPSNAE